MEEKNFVFLLDTNVWDYISIYSTLRRTLDTLILESSQLQRSKEYSRKYYNHKKYLDTPNITRIFQKHYPKLLKSKITKPK